MKKIIKKIKEDWLGYAIILYIGIVAFTKNYIALSIAEVALVCLFLGEIKNEIRNKK